MADGWIAKVSDGSEHYEEWINGELSPWQRLMNYCHTKNEYVTSLRLNIGPRTVYCNENAVGYWQANGVNASQGLECDEELHKQRGIGFVEDGVVHIIWGMRDPTTHDPVFWMDSRDPENQAQIIWSISLF